MDNELVLCKHCTRCFNSPRGLRSHMKVHKKKQPCCGGVTYSASSSNPKDEAAGALTTMGMMVLVELPLALQMIEPLSLNYNVAEDPCLQGSQQKGGVVSSSSSNPKDEAGVLGKATTMVHEEPQPWTLQMAVVPSSSSRHTEAEDRRRRHGRGGQGSQQQRREYVCVECDMSFNSHYALGGHRSSKHSRKRLQQQSLLLPAAAPNNNNNQVGLLLRRSQRLRLFGFNLDVVPAASSS